MAIGNPFALTNTVTVGVVSAVGRTQQTVVSGRYEEMIQTDAAINRGNSGGPLLNIRGEVVGINTPDRRAIRAAATSGIGFAVPINTVEAHPAAAREGQGRRGAASACTVSRIPMTTADAQDLGLDEGDGRAGRGRDGEARPRRAGISVDDVIVEFNGKAGEKQ